MKRLMIALTCAVAVAAGCTRTVYLPTETVRTVHSADTRIVRDTLRAVDTIRIDRGGDTIRVDRTHWRTRTLHTTDTVVRIATDTVRVSVSVPRELTGAQRRWMTAGKCAATALAALIVGGIALWWWRRRR